MSAAVCRVGVLGVVQPPGLVVVLPLQDERRAAQVFLDLAVVAMDRLLDVDVHLWRDRVGREREAIAVL